MEVIQRVQPADNEENKQTEVLAELHKLFNEQGYSDYVVVYLRLITSGQLQEGADFYQNFIDGNCTMKEFCHQEVEPMYKVSFIAKHSPNLKLNSKRLLGVWPHTHHSDLHGSEHWRARRVHGSFQRDPGSGRSRLPRRSQAKDLLAVPAQSLRRSLPKRR